MSLSDSFFWYNRDWLFESGARDSVSYHTKPHYKHKFVEHEHLIIRSGKSRIVIGCKKYVVFTQNDKLLIIWLCSPDKNVNKRRLNIVIISDDHLHPAYMIRFKRFIPVSKRAELIKAIITGDEKACRAICDKLEVVEAKRIDYACEGETCNNVQPDSNSKSDIIDKLENILNQITQFKRLLSIVYGQQSTTIAIRFLQLLHKHQILQSIQLFTIYPTNLSFKTIADYIPIPLSHKLSVSVTELIRLYRWTIEPYLHPVIAIKNVYGLIRLYGLFDRWLANLNRSTPAVLIVYDSTNTITADKLKQLIQFIASSSRAQTINLRQLSIVSLDQLITNTNATVDNVDQIVSLTIQKLAKLKSSGIMLLVTNRKIAEQLDNTLKIEQHNTLKCRYIGLLESTPVARITQSNDSNSIKSSNVELLLNIYRFITVVRDKQTAKRLVRAINKLLSILLKRISHTSRALSTTPINRSEIYFDSIQLLELIGLAPYLSEQQLSDLVHQIPYGYEARMIKDLPIVSTLSDDSR